MQLNFKIKLIACGSDHVLILTENNELFGCDKYNFVKIIDNNRFVDDEIKGLACGECFSTFFTKMRYHLISKFFYFSGDSFINGKISSFTKFYCNTNIVNVKCGSGHIIMLDKFEKLFYSDKKLQEMVYLEMPFKIKQIGSGYNFITLLNENNELYFKRECGFDDSDAIKDFTKIEINVNSNNQVNKIFSGLACYVYFRLATTTEKLYFFNIREETEILELDIPLKETEKFVYPFIGSEFIYVIVSNNSLFGEESKECLIYF